MAKQTCLNMVATHSITSLVAWPAIRNTLAFQCKLLEGSSCTSAQHAAHGFCILLHSDVLEHLITVIPIGQQKGKVI